MKRMQWMFLLLVINWAALAQTDTPLTTSAVVDAWVTNTENHLLGVADAMPADKYTFVPTNGQFTHVRTFGEQLKHLAANNYWAAAMIRGEKPTPDELSEKGPDSIHTKPDVRTYLKGSFTSLHQAVATINEKNAVQPIPGVSGPWQRARLGLAIDAVVHSFDHYGQLVEYLRMNNITPPSSR